MDWNGLKRKLQAEHPGDPRTLAYLEKAFELGREALDIFAQFGHKFHLAPGPGTASTEWPKMMFHVEAAPNGRMVRDEYELYDLGDGWENSLEDAQVRDGIMAQFTGRGGVNRRSLPSVLPGEGVTSKLDAAGERKKRIADFKEQRDAE